jgi:hypothetical protein
MGSWKDAITAEEIKTLLPIIEGPIKLLGYE